MTSTRREWLILAGFGAVIAAADRRGAEAQETATSDVARRITKVIREYEAQGFHRTATAVDDASGVLACGPGPSNGIPRDSGVVPS